MKVGFEYSKKLKWKQGPNGECWEYKKEDILQIFPSRLRVLVVDDDRVCLTVVAAMLNNSLYEVTKTSSAVDALSLLRENKNAFDIIVTDVRMPEMDGFELLDHVNLEMDIPVILMSADDDKKVVMKGITHGACDYLIKPVRSEELRNIWQHVYRKRKKELLGFQHFLANSGEEGKRRQRSTNDQAGTSSEGSSRNAKRNKDKEIETGEKDNTSSKKPRVVWSVELHQQFVVAVNKLGLEKAVPKKILELMKIPGLSRENVASHLQKYRLYIRKFGDGSRLARCSSALILNSEEENVGSVNSIQFSPQNLETFFDAGPISARETAASLGRSTTRSSALYQTAKKDELFSFRKFGRKKEKPMDLLYGIPTSMEPTQFANMYQSLQQPFVRANMQANPSLSQCSSGVLMQATQQLSSRPRMTKGGASSSSAHVSRPFLLPDLSVCHNNPVPQMNPCTVLSSSSFVFGSSSRIPPLPPKGLVQNEVNREFKVPRRLIPSDDIFNELNQHNTQDRSSHNPALPSVSVNQGVISTWQNTNSSIGGSVNAPDVGQQLNASYVDSPGRVKGESMGEPSYQNTIYLSPNDQEDLMSALLKQQEGIGEVEGEFGFMDFSLDDLPMLE